MMEVSGPWSSDRVQAFLAGSLIPLRLATHGHEGFPRIVSLWFVARDDRILCATQRDSYIAKRLTEDRRCAFEVSVETPPYCGVRGTASARLDDSLGESTLKDLIARYLRNPDGSTSHERLERFLLDQSDQETAIVLEPHTLSSWDYSDRMGDDA